MHRVLPLSVVLVLLLLSSCRKPAEVRPEEPPAPVATTHTTSSDVDLTIESIDVPNDRAALFVDGKRDDKRVLVHLHGMCAGARDDLAAWGAVAKERGTIVALMGDVACPEPPGTTRWSEDASGIDRRITAAIEAASARRKQKLDVSNVVLIGESMGAARAELLATKFPERYARLVLIGSPQKPSAQGLKAVQAVANVVAQNEPQLSIKQGTRALDSAGLRTRLFVLPGSSHGDYGADGVRVMNEAIGFVAD